MTRLSFITLDVKCPQCKRGRVRIVTRSVAAPEGVYCAFKSARVLVPTTILCTRNRDCGWRIASSSNETPATRRNSDVFGMNRRKHKVRS